MADSSRRHDPARLLDRVNTALDEAESILARYDRAHIAELRKSGGDPVTEADLEIDRALRRALHGEGEGWLSEESGDDRQRLEKNLVWIVDPLDGTREFIDGLPEFCVSIAAVVNGRPTAGGVVNPAAGVRVVGAVGVGLSCNGRRVEPPEPMLLEEMTVLASRSEVSRGQWATVADAGIAVRPMGSVAYKMARVAAALDRATWTPVPKHEWDVAGGAALLAAAGGTTLDLDGRDLVFNQEVPWLRGAIAVPPGFERHVDTVIELVAAQSR